MPLLGPDGQPLDTAKVLEDAREAVDDETAEAVAPEPVECITAFVVYQLPNGLWQVSTDIDVPLIPQREAHGDDLTSGCSTTLRDVTTRETAQAILNSDFGPAIVQSTTQSVIANMGMIGQQMVQAKESAAVAKELEKDRQRRGGR